MSKEIFADIKNLVAEKSYQSKFDLEFQKETTNIL